MTSQNTCGCKGIRSCLICEQTNTLEIGDETKQQVYRTYVYCGNCKKAWQSDDDDTTLVTDQGGCGRHQGDSLDFPGVTIVDDFVTEEEELNLCDVMDKTVWKESQSGRRKQDYGPRVNFKKKKLKTSVFTGLPSFSEVLVKRMQELEVLQDFHPVELCNLDYAADRGSAIDPHFDDFWIWGDRLVTLTLLSGTRHRMTLDSSPDVEVFIHLPKRSLVVVQGPARYEWKHGILRKDIAARRVAMTFRELTPEFLEGGQSEDVGKLLLTLASSFQGQAVGTNKNTNKGD